MEASVPKRPTFQAARTHRPDVKVALAKLTALRIDRRRQQFEAGEGWALLDAIDLCGHTGTPLPPWVQQGFAERYRRWLQYDAGSLDEAFSVKRKQNKRQAKVERLKSRVAIRVLKLHRNGVPLDEALFDTVGRDLEIAGGTVRKIYYDKSNPWPKLLQVLSPKELSSDS
jgi:hypothetical protein